MNEPVDTDDQISPAAIAYCECCGVKNFVIGGRTTDGKFHPAYLSYEGMRAVLPQMLGQGAWCGVDGPAHFLRLFRVICTAVKVRAAGMDVTLSLCLRCARHVVSHQARESEANAA